MKPTIRQRWGYVYERMRQDVRSWRSWLSTGLFFASYAVKGPYKAIILAVTIALVVWQVRDDYRRRRPRQRMRDGGVMLGILTFIFIAVSSILYHVEGSGNFDPWEVFYPGLILAGMTGVLMVIFLWRWRRLRADAEVRLWYLQKMREKSKIR